MTNSILLPALVGAGVSFLVTLFFDRVRQARSRAQIASRYQSREEEIWE